MDYSKEINAPLGNSKPFVSPMIENTKTVLKSVVEEPTSLKDAWELMEMFYADDQAQPWIPERFLDWLVDFGCLFSATHSTVHAKLVAFQEKLVTIQTVENALEYWEVLSSALAVGWIDVVIKLLLLHGSYLFDQLGSHELWKGMIELLGIESKTAGGLGFLKKYRDFRRSLQQVQDGATSEDARKAAETLISLMRSPSTPQLFWLLHIYDSLKLLKWHQRPLFNVYETNLLLNKELSLSKFLPGFIVAELPSEALKSVRLALATHLGRTSTQSVLFFTFVHDRT